MTPKNPVFWTTSEGVKMNVDDMDDNHVRNAFKQLVRRINLHNILTKREMNYIKLNGDMAIEFNQSMDATEIDIY
jgi:hypothetical protein